MENGLVEGVTYIKDESTGRINWLEMIPEEYLYINIDKKGVIEKRLNKPFNEISVKEVKDTELILTLQGIRWLLDLRGYKSAYTKIDVASPEYAAATCTITFIPNEEENFQQEFSSSASAHPGNTKSFYRNYLVEAASNRALCRAVRNFLKINIVSKEELSDASPIEEENKTSTLLEPVEMLSQLLKERGILFEDAIKDLPNSDKWKSINDIPKTAIFKIMGKIKAS